MSDKRTQERILQSPCNKRFDHNYKLLSYTKNTDVHSIHGLEGIVLPNMELLRMFDVALNLDIIYTALLFFPGEDPVIPHVKPDPSCKS